MGRRSAEISDGHRAFIGRQKIFFTATAAPGGRVNVSPKGMDSLRVLAPGRVVWLSVTGSGNETAAHLAESDRMTLMFCSFEAEPLILRLYGQARAIHPADAEWPRLIALFSPLPGARQLFDLHVDLVQTSCGMAVPFFDYRGERGALNAWAEKKGPEGIRAYQEEKNRVSLDGKPIPFDGSGKAGS